MSVIFCRLHSNTDENRLRKKGCAERVQFKSNYDYVDDDNDDVDYYGKFKCFYYRSSQRLLF